MGTHGYLTNPLFIERFYPSKKVKFIKGDGPTFHPKVYLFERRNGDWACLIGSANFTRPGFHSNQEACFLVTSDDPGSANVRQEAEALISRCWKKKGLSLADVKAYAENAKRRPPSPAVDDIEKENGKNLSQLQAMSWRQFCRAVKAGETRRGDKIQRRIELLEHVRSCLSKKSLRGLDTGDRKLIGGFGSPMDEKVPLYEWGAFGSMRGAGSFKKLINNQNAHLSKALDEIPLTDDVSEEQYDAFMHLYRKAFPRGKGQGIATATRLLAMKRPDWFVCIDGANRAQLRKRLGRAPQGHNYKGYWNYVINKVHASTWWKAPEPKSRRDSAIWRGRAAFIDSICYRPKIKKS